MGNFSNVAAPLQVYANLLCICHHRLATSWTLSWYVVVHEKDFKVSSMGWIGL